MCEIFGAVVSWLDGAGILAIDVIGPILIDIIEAIASALQCSL